MTTPYATAWWGHLLARTFGGRFVELTCPGEPEYWCPALVGGSLAHGVFASGAVGYGGVYQAGVPVRDPVVVQAFLRLASKELGPAHGRIVLPPPSPAAPFNGVQSVERHTFLKLLPATRAELVPTYRTPVRTQVRRAGEDCDLQAGDLSADHLKRAIELIHTTQARVGAGYRSPAELIEHFVTDRSPSLRSFGTWYRGELMSVGCFVVNGSEAAYYLNGWERGGSTAPVNASMLHFGLARLIDAGVRLVDLGSAHSADLARTKLQWGADAVPFTALYL